ncbi:glycosyltransferase family 4 protein [Caulobacter sp. BK020]|uniref:glycosyltransferase family 4 protein n=1 Tax=Caulobacter sp. BK020 TaxID=2512117 RepID=UPI00104EEFD3|nr:glycosyltransferase family 4 protein [Caulobacter sp. BK020]TCS04326.1 glycosyltransferase involved in cell wall biosynthesis [Caulobacter sp. BK020]
MRIFYVINSVEGGGAALPVPAVAKVLQRLGAKVEVLALIRRDGRALPPMTRQGLEVHVRPGAEKDHIAALAWLDRMVVEGRPDLLWTSLTRATLLGQIVGLRRGVPVVSWQHSAYLKTANRLLLRATQGLSDLWIGDSHSVTALTASRLKVKADRLTTWPLFAADETAPQATPWRPGQTLQLGALGRLHPAKGYDLLIKALAHLRASGFVSPTPFEVRIAGEGAQRELLQGMIDQAGLDNVRLTGFCEAPREFLAGLHLYLQPSRREGLCVAVHEAMQAGLPSLVTAVGEMPYSVVDGLTGRVVPPCDSEKLAKALRQMLSAPRKLAAMGERARSRVLERFGRAHFEATGAEIFARLPVRREVLVPAVASAAS